MKQAMAISLDTVDRERERERESYNSRKRKSRIVKDSNTHTMFIRK